MKFFILIFLLSCSTSKTLSPEQTPLSKIMRAYGIPGASVSIMEGDKIIFRENYGQRALGYSAGVETDDQWHLGSCAKPLTAIVVGRLIQEGKLSLSTKLGDISQLKTSMLKPQRSITIEMLLSHRSGLVNVGGTRIWGSLFSEENASRGRDNLVKELLLTPLTFSPGSKEEYSNGGYTVLGWIVEKMLNVRWEEYLKQTIFTELSMESCGFGAAGKWGEKTPTQPWGHQIVDGKLMPITPDLTADNPGAISPSGGLHCGLTDWHKLLQKIADGYHGDTSLLDQKTFQKFFGALRDGKTLASIMSMEREWANGRVLASEGSNTLNLATQLIVPGKRRTYLVAMNAGPPKTDEANLAILMWLTKMDLK